jgi:plastocyanin
MKKLTLILLAAAALFAMDHVVNQKGKTFIPHELTVKVGDTITFLNSDPFAHNAYTDDEANEFDIGMQPTGTKRTVKVRAPGKFDVECAIHPNMLLEVTATK